MEAVSTIILECPKCGEGPHRVLRGRASAKSLEAVVRCVSCGHTQKQLIRAAEEVEVALVVSWEGESRRTTLSVDRDERLAVGQEVYIDDQRLMITALDAGGERVQSSPARDVTTVWTKRFHRVSVKIALRIGGRTVPHEMAADPDEEFSVGDLVELNKRKAVIYKIVTVERRRARVCPARNVHKVYARAIKERWS